MKQRGTRDPEGEERGSGTHCQLVNMSTDLVGAPNLNYFPQNTTFFHSVTFLGLYFLNT